MEVKPSAFCATTIQLGFSEGGLNKHTTKLINEYSKNLPGESTTMLEVSTSATSKERYG
jgi:hypothetical protein